MHHILGRCIENNNFAHGETEEQRKDLHIDFIFNLKKFGGGWPHSTASGTLVS